MFIRKSCCTKFIPSRWHALINKIYGFYPYRISIHVTKANISSVMCGKNISSSQWLEAYLVQNTFITLFIYLLWIVFIGMALIPATWGFKIVGYLSVSLSVWLPACLPACFPPICLSPSLSAPILFYFLSPSSFSYQGNGKQSGTHDGILFKKPNPIVTLTFVNEILKASHHT